MPMPTIRRVRSLPLNRVVRTIREQKLFAPGHHLLVAISGGPDSTALLAVRLRLAPSWHLRVTAVHVNYRLRGTESDEDEAWVTAFCRDRGVPLVVLRPTLVKEKRRSSLQAIARDARYDAMKALAREVGADRIVVGHTADDQAETVLMWMLRGAGLTGLAGMPFVREGLIVRPLLSTTKRELIEFLDQEGLAYREDSSNRSDRYRRNRIRRELLPIMTKIAPAAVRLLQRQASLLREDDRYLDEVARERWPLLVRQGADGEPALDRSLFLALPAALQRRLLRLLFRTYEVERRAFSADAIESARRFLFSGKAGTSLTLKQLIMSHDGKLVRIKTRRTASSDSNATSQAVEDLELSVIVPATVH